MLGNLNSMALSSFLENYSLRDELCVFVHIPKTAGSSFSSELHRLREPYRNIHVSYADGQQVSKIEDAITQTISSVEVDSLRSCSGHFTWNQAAPLRERRPDARFISFLRNPSSRVISDYRYARTPTHPTFRDFIERYPDIESYVAARESQNKMARFMLPSLKLSRAEIEEHLDRSFLFIGLLEMYPMSFNLVSRLLGKNGLPSEHKRKTVETADNKVEDSAALHAMINDANDKDRMIYEIVRKRLVARRDDWRVLSAARRARAA